MTEKEAQKSSFGGSEGTSKSIQFKGRPGAFELHLHPDSPLLEILSDLQSSLEDNLTLLQSRPVRLQFGDRPIDLLQYHEVRRVLEAAGITLESISVTPTGLKDYLEGEFELPVTIQVPVSKPTIRERIQRNRNEAPPPLEAPAVSSLELETLKTDPAPPVQVAPQPVRAEPARQEYHPPQTPYVARSIPTPAPLTAPTAHPSRPGPEETAAAAPAAPRLHKIMRTCRAGSYHDIDGDVVIFGDVNPGAEIRATGDIFVLGSLRGLAHAGYGGKQKNAIIVAYDLSPTQLRLGKNIAMAPKGEEVRTRPKVELEVAYLNENNQIEVELYQGRMTPSLRSSLKSSS